RRAGVLDRVHGRDERERRRDHLVSRADSRGDEREVERRGARADRDDVRGADVRAEPLLEQLDERPVADPRPADRLPEQLLLRAVEAREPEDDAVRRPAHERTCPWVTRRRSSSSVPETSSPSSRKVTTRNGPSDAQTTGSCCRRSSIIPGGL